MALAQIAEATEDWGCVKIMTYSGPIYLAVDEEQRTRMARDGRAVFTRDEIEPFLRSMATLDPYQRHLALGDAVMVKQACPSARVDGIVPRTKEERDASKGDLPTDPDVGTAADSGAKANCGAGAQAAIFDGSLGRMDANAGRRTGARRPRRDAAGQR